MISRLYFDKNNAIIRECSGKKVLDLGVVDHDVREEQKSNWLHGKLRKAAREITGIDIDKSSIEILKKKGYNVKVANVEDFNLRDKFDVIVAGDIMEHLNNVGSFLNSVKKHMGKDSVLILTLPNCLSFSNWIELLIFGRIKYINEEHTAWYDANTARKILSSNGFEIQELSFINHNPHFVGESRMRAFMKDIRHLFASSLCLLRPQSAPTLFIKARLK